MESKNSQIKEQNKQWLQNQINHILQPMMHEISVKNPANPTKFMVEYLEREFGDRATLGDLSQIDTMKKRIAELKIKVETQQATKNSTQSETRSNQGSEHETDEDDDDDYVDDLPIEKIKQKAKGPRSSVSAEAFGSWNQKSAFQAKVVPKGEDEKAKIYEKLNQSFMFSNLDESEKKIVIDAMEERKVTAKTCVIKEGEEGAELFMVQTGKLACTKVFKGNTEPTHLKNYEPGEAFGELALLYNAPRAATITANEDCILWALDRQTFTHIVKDSASKKRAEYEEFLEKVSLLATMEPYERMKLADAFKTASYKAGDHIIKENEPGNEMYFLQEGNAIATKVLQAGAQPTQVMEYKVGDYFGERALVKNEPRAANVIAKTDCKCVYLDRHSVKRLLGPLEKLLQRNMEVYDKYKCQE